MREMSRYQMNVAVVTSSLRMRSGKDSPEAEAARVWRSFPKRSGAGEDGQLRCGDFS